MTHLIKTLIRLISLSVLWLLVRFTQFVLELSELIHEADAVSMAELYLQCDIQKMVAKAAPKFVKAWVEV
ncbi:hypothetical protein D0962_28415 [Leptolyngbyaceae cyanobacterium CCMR0082]|uniref:Uncharacterized protein n=1 Tax=Adonisia turfae CCMR0082 TaxID=2304604 RepID=A0A6M0SDQ7_9CYAN|nr:hypothetical protein [Adonisia turfae]NEZ66637.1 hypothetical protein [Adonisia turfae CCMR0082]